ncbi:MAG: ORF6N domain-containing protein [Paludibacteraceae bacterium]|nr:ORF6N domain-containing protein [Paludibacteraceae bacterium]MBR1878196.1 ORF6N domain-containing protein [Paludibacteraceae bacterium]
MAKKKDIEKVESAPLQPWENIENLIQVIRGKQVILDRDLARLYGVETRRLNEQVRRNIERFPADFMFQLTKEEAELSRSQFATLNAEDEILKSQNATSSDDFPRSQFATLNDEEENLKSQIATSSEDSSRSQIATLNARGSNIKYLPYAFTENGIAMLSSVLRSPVAIATNIQIMRAFTAMRRFIAANAQVFQRLEVIEHTQLSLAAHQEEADKKFEEIFRRLDDGSVTQKQGIFYDGQIFDAYVFITERVREAKKRIVLIDNYIDESVFTILDKRPKGVKAKVYTKNLTPQLSLDLEKHNAQYAPIEVEPFDRSHDRFLCIDETVYHIGASLKDLGKKWFAFANMELTTDELLTKI